MDSITHIALGACMGEAFAGKQLGRKAMLWGAAAQSVPDIDFVTSIWMDPTSTLLAHRGFTHSLLCCALLSLLFAWASERLHRPHNIRFSRWLLFYIAAIFSHIFLDAFNTYGVGWFEPFNHYRISFNALYVADPFFSIWPLLALVALLILKKDSHRRRQWWIAGLGLSLLYLGYSCINKLNIDRQVNHIFVKQNIPHDKYFSTPAPLQNWLWYIVAGNNSGYYVGYRSLFDKRENIDFHFFPKNKQLLGGLAQRPDVARLVRFSQDYYTVEQWHDSLVFNDLRFGQIIGWQYPTNKFAFYYFLQYPDENMLAVQRGRFSGWDAFTLRFFLHRVAGRQDW